MVTPAMRAAAEAARDSVHKVSVRSPLVGNNRNGMNVYVDDWCGPDLQDAVSGLVPRQSYNMAFVNYAFLSAVFDRINAYTEKEGSSYP